MQDNNLYNWRKNHKSIVLEKCARHVGQRRQVREETRCEIKLEDAWHQIYDLNQTLWSRASACISIMCLPLYEPTTPTCTKQLKWCAKCHYINSYSLPVLITDLFCEESQFLLIKSDYKNVEFIHACIRVTKWDYQSIIKYHIASNIEAIRITLCVRNKYHINGQA